MRHSKTCRCKACIAYLQVIRRLYPERNHMEKIASNEVASLLNTPLFGCTCGKTIGFMGSHKKGCALFLFQPSVAEKPSFSTEREQEVARATFSVLKRFERLARSNDLKKPENIQKISVRVQAA